MRAALTASVTIAATSSSFRNLTCVFAGWTLASTMAGSILMETTATGWRPVGMRVLYPSATALMRALDLTSRPLT